MKIKFPRQSAFFNPRALIGALLCFMGVALALFAFRNVSAQSSNPSSPQVSAVNRGLAPVVKFDVSPPLRNMQIIQPGPGKLRENEERDVVPWKTRFAPEWDPVVQSRVGGRDFPAGTEISGPIVTFNAQPNTGGVAPPDPNGAVGPNHIVAMGNLSFQIFNKTGTSLFGPAANNTLWAGFGGPCQTENSGDPVVLYDKLANRWFLSQFTSAGPNYFFCVAVSQTADPTGAYYRYAISTGNNFPDYPKASVWPDAYYVSTREFAGGSTFVGVGAYALNRAQAVAGNPAAQIISFLVPPSPAYVVGDGLLSSDLDGPTLPPAGSPNFYIGSQDNNGPYGAPSDALNLFKFHADFATPANSTFTGPTVIPVAAFNSILGLCGGSRSCIPQPGTTNKIDHLGYRQRPLFRFAYRNFGDHESLVTNQSVSGGTGPNGEVSGIRWWELRSPNSAPFIYQEGTYAPGVTDGIHRWMGSIAMDGEGNMALGYSSANGASPAVFPSVNYTGRFPSSPLGTMPLGEGTIIAGTGSQTAGGNRWGDYTSLSVDPTDDLTFWHVNEWVPTTSASGWQLRVGSFKVSAVPTNLLSNGGRSVVAAGPNGVPDPGEAVTVSLAARNIGGPGVICTTAGLTGTLQAGGGVTNPSAPQNYGMLCSGGPSAFRNFTFTVDPALPCGSTVTASLVMTDGATNYGTFTYTFVTGNLATSFTQNFDGVVAPALPAGWTTSATGIESPWVTSTTTPNSAPNEAFAPDPSNVGDTQLISTAFAVPAGGAQLSFKNNYNTESTYDGEVLEISINGGAYADIITAGGTFVSGGYVGPISTSFASPIAGRQAWNGNSGGYINSVINLPPAANGQMVQFKWRMASDNSVAVVGVMIDDISVSAATCGGNAPTASSIVSRHLQPATPFGINMPLGSTSTSGVECRRGTGGSNNNHQLVLTFGSPVTFGGATVASVDGLTTATPSVSGNTVTIDLAGVADAQVLGVTLSAVNDGMGNLGNINIPMGILLGDTNGDRSVNAADVGQTKSQSGNTVSGSNFREDLNLDGNINAGDVGLVKSRSGSGIP